MATPPEQPKPEPSWGAWVVIAGLLTIAVIFVVAVDHYESAAQVATAMGSVTGVIAALVGTYFGIRSTYTAHKLAAKMHADSVRHAGGGQSGAHQQTHGAQHQGD